MQLIRIEPLQSKACQKVYIAGYRPKTVSVYLGTVYMYKLCTH